VAGSTHPGEETLLLAAHRRLRVRLPQTLLVLAPRHAGRFEEVAAWLDRQGVRYRRRATGEACDAGTEVLLLDTLGELVAFYAAADVAFVAGSLIPIGGHNLLEPAALGRAVLTGPHHFNAPDVFRVLKQAGAVEVVEDAAALAAALVALLTDPVRRNRMGERGHAAIERNRGSLARVLNLLVTLTSSVSSGRASR
jgi:3-deoxy-D-manno-octulosonic-acid transferase